jgi:integrase
MPNYLAPKERLSTQEREKGYMQLTKSKKDEDLFYYFNAKGEKRWCYRHRYYDALGKRREKSKQGFEKENEAYRALLEVKTSILNGNVKKVDNSNLTISEWLDIWYETHKNDWKITSRQQRENAIKYQMKPLIGHYKLDTLDKSTYKREYINVLLKKYEPNTVRLFHRLFKIAINAAVDDEIIPRNRFNKISIPVEAVNDNFLIAEELNEFLKTAKKTENITNYTLILLLSYTGLRKGEAHGLKWKNVDFEDKIVTVERTRDNKGVRTPKTKNSYRTIIIDDLLIEQLKLYRTWCKQTILSFGRHLSDDDFIFISYQSGTPLTDNTIKYSMERIAQKGGLKQITPHGLRHTHATILISKKQPVNVIADRLGNTPQMIWETYGHNFKAMEQESVIAFSQALNF